jgi:hypothetical protein
MRADEPDDVLQFKKGFASAFHATIEDAVRTQQSHYYVAEEMDASGHYEARYSSSTSFDVARGLSILRLTKDRTHDSYFAFPDPAANHRDAADRFRLAHTTELVIAPNNGTILVTIINKRT